MNEIISTRSPSDNIVSLNRSHSIRKSTTNPLKTSSSSTSNLHAHSKIKTEGTAAMILTDILTSVQTR